MYNIISTEIEPGLLYVNAGDQSVIYNSITYTTGQTFRGVVGVSTFSYSGSGTQVVNELPEIRGGAIEFAQNITEYPEFHYDYDYTVLKGAAVVFNQNSDELIFPETTTIRGAVVEFVPNYSLTFSVNTRTGLIPPAAALQVLPSRITYFGDSMTANDVRSYNYPNKVFAANGITKTNYGVGGAAVCTSSYAATGGSVNLIDLYNTEVSLGYTGQLVSFAYTHNDYNYGIVNDTWKATYKAIIQAFITAGFPAKRLMLIIEPAHSSISLMKSQTRQYIREIASELGILLYDVYQRFIDTGVNDSFYGVDTTHPLDPGQQVWADGYDTFLRR